MSLDVQILTALRQGKHGIVSGGELATRLGVTRAAIWARIQELRALGYEIEASPHTGYRLRRAPDVLLGDDLRSRLGPSPVIGRDVQVFQQTTSTNDVIERMARDQVPEGAVVFAETQTKGRGRLGRNWTSPSKKGLWFSVLLRPKFHPSEATRLTIASATALTRAIRSQTGLAADIKWPNDLLMGGRKIAGTLTEMHAELDQVQYVILGIGLNVNLTTQDFPPELRKLATSLRIESGHPVHRADLAAAILRELDHDYARIRGGAFEAVANEWEALCTTLGRDVAIRVGPRIVYGRAEALDADAALLVRTEHGHLERIVGGDVTLEK